MVIHVKSRHGFDPYFDIPMHRLMKGWRKKWFYLNNDAFTSLPALTGSHPIPLPSWGGWSGQEGPRQVAAHARGPSIITAGGPVDVSQLPDLATLVVKNQDVTVFEVKLDYPSSEELNEAEVNSRIHKVLDLGADLNPGACPALLQEGVASARVSMLGSVSVAYAILSFHHAHGLTQGL
jgi:hypothetical protein